MIKKMFTTVLVIFPLIFLSACVSQSDYDNLKNELDTVKANYDSVVAERDQLQAQITSLNTVKSELETVKAQYDTVTEERDELKSQVEDLQAQVEALSKDEEETTTGVYGVGSADTPYQKKTDGVLTPEEEEYYRKKGQEAGEKLADFLDSIPWN